MVVGKDDGLDTEGLARVKLISDKKRQLQDTADQVRNDIKGCFERLAQAVKGRERQLLRQVEAIHRQQLSLVQSNSELLPASSSGLEAKLANEQELIQRLLNFGKIELANSIAVNDSEPYKAEEYLEAGEDVISFYKSLKSENDSEIDVSSVIRRKRDSFGNRTKNITINLNCASGDTRKLETAEDLPAAAAAGPSRLVTDGLAPTPTSTPSPASSSASSSEQRSPPFHGGEATVFVAIKSKTRDEEPLDLADPRGPRTSDQQKNDKALDNNKDAEHSIQIQQWLQKILTETETEPIIHEIGQFSSVPNSQLYREFPVET